jgi:hypothetical protein
LAKFERPTQTPVAPLRRKSTGAYTPKDLWRPNAEKSLAPLCRKRFGSLTAKVHTVETLRASGERTVARLYGLVEHYAAGYGRSADVDVLRDQALKSVPSWMLHGGES